MMIKLGTLSATTNAEIPKATKTTTPAKRKRKTTRKHSHPPAPAPTSPAPAKPGSPGRAKRTPRRIPAVAQYSPHKPLKPILLPLRTYAKTAYIKPSYRQMYCPVVRSIAVTGGSRGMQFQFLGFDGGIQYRGRGLRQAPATTGAGVKTKLKGKAQQTKARATTAASAKKKMSSPSSRTPASRVADGQTGVTARTPRALSFPTTPNKSGRPTDLDTPSLPIVKTPSRPTTQSAKRFRDALQASPLALLADAAEMESPHLQTLSAQCAKGTRTQNNGNGDSVSRDVTPSPDKEGQGAAAWSSRGKTPTSIPTFGGEDARSEIVSPPPTKGKRYSIRPKDKSRTSMYGASNGQGVTASTPLSLLADMLYEEESLPVSSDDKQDDDHAPKNPYQRHHRPSTSSASADLAQGAAALASVMTGKVES
mmetsp:Transcript_25819/g.74698  ORF Transcript_25819/g.74698 Transcript_25819/m.74698 type:complete len:422 (+) Transcript_25819:197-1462(+)